MSESGGGGGSPAGPSQGAVPPKQQPPREIPAFLRPLRFMGVPKAVLTWQPKMPSRNTSIFLGVTITLASLYIYDRRECERIRQEYKDKVKHLADEPLLPREYPRKVLVYTARSPGDDDYEKSLLFFKKYVKPILVAAAIDWEVVNGTRHGGLARELRERIYARRRQLLGLEPWATPPATASSDQPDLTLTGALPFALTPQEQLERELDGGIVLVGRPAYKEWTWGLKQGWTTRLPPSRQDLDEPLARELSNDDKFDEEEVEDKTAFVGEVSSGDDGAEADGAGAPLPSRMASINPRNLNPAFASPQSFANNRNNRAAGTNQDEQQQQGPAVNERLLDPPSAIPAQPPLCFVDYVNLVGFSKMPRRIVGFFNQRHRVLLGAEAGLQVALGDKSTARPFDAPPELEIRSEPPQGGDLDWGLDPERFYPGSFAKTLSEIEKARSSWYEALPRRLRDTRTLVRGEREPTATEKNDPPKTEGELREERFTKEREWRNLANGFDILRPENGVRWDERFRDCLRVFSASNAPSLSSSSEELKE